MDLTTPESLDQAVKGLAVLAAIPVVLFALWADYYVAYLRTAIKSAPQFDPKIEKERVHIAAACVVLFEFILFVGSLDIIEAYPKICSAVFLAGLIGIGYVQAGVEKQFVPKQLGPAPLNPRKAVSGFRALLFGLLSGFLYVATLVMFVKVSAWVAGGFHFSSPWSAVFVMTGAAAGIFSGLTLNFALAPWQMKNSVSVTPMTEEEAITVSAPMDKAGLKNFSLWVIEDRLATAAIAGFSWGRGVFRPALFVSRTVMNSLTKEELTAVVAHEAAHVLAQHLRKRVLLSASLIIALTFMAVFGTLATFTFFPGASTQSGLGMVFGIFSFGMAFFILQKQNRVHEFQADWIAIQKLGADFECWANALRKMDQMNGFPVLPGALSSHPRTETRIQNVAKMIEYISTIRKTEAPAANKDRAA
jgi:heat shock protein HtpX